MPSPSLSQDALALQSLCQQAAVGNADALARLLDHHHERLLEHAVRKVGPDWRGRIAPEDVLQEAYCDIFSGIGAFAYTGVDSFYHWAAQIVDRRYIDQVRRHRAKKRDAARETALPRPASDRSTYFGLLDQCLADSGTPSRFVSKAEALSAVMSGLARLPEDYCKVLRRVYLQGESLRDVAADMQRSEDAVRRLASRAIERLRQLLDGHSSLKN